MENLPDIPGLKLVYEIWDYELVFSEYKDWIKVDLDEWKEYKEDKRVYYLVEDSQKLIDALTE